MAPGATRKPFLVLFGLFMVFASFGLISGSKTKDQATFQQLDRSDAESMKEQQLQADINILRKELEAPLGSYIPQVSQESNHLMSRILSELQPLRATPQEHLAWKKTKRWAPHKTKGNAFKKRWARFVEDVKRKAVLPSVYREGSTFRKLSKRQACITSLQNGEDRIQRSLSQGEKRRCVRSSYFGDKEPKTQAALRYSKGSKTKKADWRKNSKRFVAYKKEQMLQERRKRAAYTEKSHFLSSKPSYRSDSSYSLSSYFTPSTTVQRASLKKLKRSISHFHTEDKNLGDTFRKNLLKAMEGESREKNAQTGMSLKKREAKATETLPVKTVHLTLTALKTQEKLSEMVDRISDPSNPMSPEERLTYMHELLNELTTFIQLLRQQIARQTQNDTTSLTTASTL